MQSPILELLRRYNRISVILISMLTSLAIIYVSLYISIFIYTLPVAAFVVMHYLKFYKFVPRLAASLLITFIAIIMASGVYAETLYTSNGVEAQSLANGTNITATVTPFNHPATDYNFSFSLTGNKSIGNYYIVVQGLSNNYLANYSGRTMSENDSSGALILYVHDSNLSASGAYEFSLYFANNTARVTSIGPTFSAFSLFGPFLLSVGPSYFITFELIFVIGLFIARSFSNSARYRNPPISAPTEPTEEVVEGDQKK